MFSVSNLAGSDVADTKFCVRSQQEFFICDTALHCTALHCTAKLLPKIYIAPRCTAIIYLNKKF